MSARADSLVVAEMLDEIAHDVRYSLGASYTFGAVLGETRLARYYVVAGWIDATRATAAVQLVRDRIHELRSDPDAAMRAFVIARRHVLTKLRSRASSATALAAAVENDVELGLGPMSDARTATEVEALTFERMAAALTELDPPACHCVMMRRPGFRDPESVRCARPQADLHRDRADIGRRAGPSATPTEFYSPEQHHVPSFRHSNPP